MASRKKQSGPRCVDLNTSSDWATIGGASPVRPSQNAKFRGARRTSAGSASGAVRRASSPVNPQNKSHLGKLSAAAAIVAGAVVWTTGSSEPHTSAGKVDDLTAKAISVQQASVSAPAVFFQDESDALQRSFVAKTSANKTDNNPLDKQAAHASDKQAPVEMPSFAPAPARNDAASAALLAMVMQPSNLEQKPTADIDPAYTSGPGDEPTSVQPADLSKPASLEKTIPRATDTGFNDLVSDSPEAITNSINQGNTDQQSGKISVTVSRGDTLSAILNDNGLKANDMNALLTNDLIKQHLSAIDIGQIIVIEQDSDGQFERLTTRVNQETRLNVERTGSEFDVSTIDLPLERRRQVTAGVIEQSLYLTAEQAKLKQSTIMELTNIFQWELDFARDIRKGDRFSLVYDKLYREGEYIGDGEILAAEFVRGGKPYRAILMTKEDGSTGYYSPEGQSKRRAFMRHPVDVVRITSKFNLQRMHPILRQTRAHRGVDYGSPHGSPIYATADGKVIHAGSKSAYGETVILKHGEKFSTLYAHMSRISKKSVPGAKVKQGDIIGYVGNTGRVTGTHLHYEFRVNGEQIDPLKVDLPTASPLDERYNSKLKQLNAQYSDLMDEALDNLPNHQTTTALSTVDSLEPTVDEVVR